MQARPQPLTKKTVSIPETRPAKSSKQEKPRQAETKPMQALVAPADGEPLNVGSLIDKAAQMVSPSYPQTARSARIAGIVKVFVIIDENGTVTKVERSDGPPMLRAAAEMAAKKWKFHPVVIDGKPVRIAGYISFNFTL
jgi:TonB family protein